MIVADTNLIASLLLGVPDTSVADAVWKRDWHWTAPILWRYELKNLLTTQIRFAGLSIDHAIGLFEKAGQIIRRAEIEVAPATILRLAVEKKLSAYDAEFLALAMALNVKVVTLDKGLLKAAAGIAVTPQEFLEA